MAEQDLHIISATSVRPGNYFLSRPRSFERPRANSFSLSYLALVCALHPAAAVLAVGSC